MLTFPGKQCLYTPKKHRWKFMPFTSSFEHVGNRTVFSCLGRVKLEEGNNMYTGKHPWVHQHEIGKSTIFQLKKTSSFIVDFPICHVCFLGGEIWICDFFDAWKGETQLFLANYYQQWVTFPWWTSYSVASVKMKSKANPRICSITGYHHMIVS